MDIFDSEDVDTGVQLLKAAMAGMPRTQYIRFVPPGWRESPAPWLEALEQTGARLFVERLRPGGQPARRSLSPRGRLRFRPVGERAELIDLPNALDGTLDAHSRSDLADKTPEQVAAARRGVPGLQRRASGGGSR